MRVRRGDGSTDDADVCSLRPVRHTRPEVESMCGHAWVWLRERHVYTSAWAVKLFNPQTRHYPFIHRAGRLIKRTITHMREGLSGWYVTIDPPACEDIHVLDEASLMDASRVYVIWVMLSSSDI
jgi:hypothetical protein